MISSGFGYRRDPFNAHPAMHSGLDFRGPTGSPIYATAPGKVTFRGVQNGYGNTVEISHGNGLVTRYAHMSAFRARLGQEVDAGEPCPQPAGQQVEGQRVAVHLGEQRHQESGEGAEGAPVAARPRLGEAEREEDEDQRIDDDQ